MWRTFASTRVGFGTGFVNTIIETHHAAHEFHRYLGSAKTFAEAWWRLYHLSETEFQGLLVYGLLLVAIWLPVAIFAPSEDNRSLGSSVLGMGLFGTLVISLMDLRYAIEVIVAHFSAVTSLSGLLSLLDSMDTAVVAGIAAYLAMVGTTWMPAVMFLLRRAAPSEEFSWVI